MSKTRTDETRIANLQPHQRRLLNDLAWSAANGGSYHGELASEDALRLSIDQRLVEVVSYHRDTGRPLVSLTNLGQRIQRKA